METDYSFPLAEKVQKSIQNETTNSVCEFDVIMNLPLSQQVKAYLADPSAFAAVAAPAAAAESAAAAPAAKEEVKEESEESDDDMGFGLFD